MSAAIQKAQQIIDSAFEKHSAHKVPVKIELSNRMTRTWGYATRKEGVYLIKLNAKVCNSETINTKAFNDLVIHELCHILEHKIYGTWSHGIKWKSFMWSYGLDANRCVTESEKEEVGYIREKRLMTKYVHKCDCKSHAVGGKIHNKMMRGANYWCTVCKTALSKEFTVTKA